MLPPPDENIRQSVMQFCLDQCGTATVRDALPDGGQRSHNQMLYNAVAARGWLALAVPPPYGGGSVRIPELCTVLEELAYARAPLSAMGASLSVANTYARVGNEAQQRELLPKILRGVPQGLALSEPDAGSDLAAISCRAEPADGGFEVSGRKSWVSNARLGDDVLVAVRTSGEVGSRRGLSLLRIDIAAAGVHLEPCNALGPHEAWDLELDRVAVNHRNLIGEEGAAWGDLMAGLSYERLILAASMLGRARRTFDDAVAYSQARTQFGHPVGSYQALKHTFADLATELWACRLIVADLARECAGSGGAADPVHASMTKLKITETAKRTALVAAQVMGAEHHRQGSEVSIDLNAAVGATIYGGTSEIQREVIGRGLGL